MPDLQLNVPRRMTDEVDRSYDDIKGTLKANRDDLARALTIKLSGKSSEDISFAPSTTESTCASFLDILENHRTCRLRDGEVSVRIVDLNG